MPAFVPERVRDKEREREREREREEGETPVARWGIRSTRGKQNNHYFERHDDHNNDKMLFRWRMAGRTLFEIKVNLGRGENKLTFSIACSVILNVPSPASFCLFSFFSNSLQNSKLYTSVGFELGSSEWKASTLTTWPPPLQMFTFIFSFTYSN